MSPTPRAGQGAPESIGVLLLRLRLARGLSQLRLAEQLCAASGTPTVSRHEVSRWEREERVPGAFWLGWLAAVLEVPLAELEVAAAGSRNGPDPTGPELLWCRPDAAELLAALERDHSEEVQVMAHAWLVGPPGPGSRPATPHRRGLRPVPAGPGEARLAELRRMDDLVGGLDLARGVDRELRAAVAALDRAGDEPTALRLVAGWAQLAGWVHADAGNPARAGGAYRVALRTAAAGADRALAAHALGSLSHQRLSAGHAPTALLLARSAHAGARRHVPALPRVLLLHRVALAAARAGERRAAHAALADAERLADRTHPDREPGWLYWLDQAELAAMTGRCLAALGRPLRAEPLLAAPRAADPGPRTTALYGAWLARTYLDLGEVERACDVAAAAWRDAVRAGSARAAGLLRHLHPVVLRHRDVPAVRGYAQLATAAARYLPAARTGPRQRAVVR